jgi:hypothetical protein
MYEHLVGEHNCYQMIECWEVFGPQFATGEQDLPWRAGMLSNLGIDTAQRYFESPEKVRMDFPS